LTPQLLWIRKVRWSPVGLFGISLIILFGMWMERFVIIITSLYRDFLPSSWGTYVATRWDYAIFAGTLGLFFSAMFLFVRLMPMITIFEMRMLLPEAKVSEEVAAHD
jgi:molybdopterin-containing oxidoreductase family membrane subunit